MVNGHMGFKVYIVLLPPTPWVYNTEIVPMSLNRSLYLYGSIVPNLEGL